MKIEEYVLSHFKNILKPPVKNLKHPFIVPGTGYLTELWGWDTYWEALAIKRSFELFGEEAMTRAGVSKKTAEAHICGSVLNFLDAQQADGYIPIMVSAGGLFEGFFEGEHKKGTPLNQHLPFLCQMTLLADEFSGGFDYDKEKLVKYMRYYEEKQYDKKSGLFFWQDDIMVGIDNNPTVFYRPHRSSADIFLNSFIYLEYVALSKLSNDADAAEKAEKLKAAINAEMWDTRDGIYYSQDVNLFKTQCVVKGVALHSGLDPHWNTMPLKIRLGLFFAHVCGDMLGRTSGENV